MWTLAATSTIYGSAGSSYSVMAAKIGENRLQVLTQKKLTNKEIPNIIHLYLYFFIKSSFMLVLGIYIVSLLVSCSLNTLKVANKRAVWCENRRA